METLELFQLPCEQIPNIDVELYPGQHKYFEKDFERPIYFPDGTILHLVFDLHYSEEAETGGGLNEEPWEHVVCTSISVDNVRLENEDRNVISVANLKEVERNLTLKKIKAIVG